jgi:hypothetical protein
MIELTTASPATLSGIRHVLSVSDNINGVFSNSLSVGGRASFANGAANFDGSGNLTATNFTPPLFPAGSNVTVTAVSSISGTNFPSIYTLTNHINNQVVGYVHLTYIGTHVKTVYCTNAARTLLTHGSWTINYDLSGNLTSAICNN